MRAMRTDTNMLEGEKRSRPTPMGLLPARHLDDIAKRRCLMVLEVLSGAKPVTEAVEETKISRQMYYQLEEKALKAMLSALMPGATETGGNPSTTARISELEAQVKKLETENRRTERLLLLTRKVLIPGTIKTAPGRPPGSKNKPGSKRPGRKPSPSSTTSTTESRPTASPSIPTKDGASGH